MIKTQVGSAVARVEPLRGQSPDLSQLRNGKEHTGQRLSWGLGADGRALAEWGTRVAALDVAVGSFASAGPDAAIVNIENDGAVLVTFEGEDSADRKRSFLDWLKGRTASASTSAFMQRTDPASAEAVFHYYSGLLNQQNMLQDVVRTGTYFGAIMSNAKDFHGKVVLDVGAGSAILSLFAVQAGARRVYAVEASAMARHARTLADGNPLLGSRIEVLHGKVEEVVVPEPVDVIISEPMGTLLVNERMLESYIYARKHFMRPGGRMFPTTASIYFGLFREDVLHAEMGQRVSFWGSHFYGVDLSSLHEAATKASYGQCVIDAFSPNVLLSDVVSFPMDFETMDEEELHVISVPIQLQAFATGPCHGIACWFDVVFDGSSQRVTLSTAPGLPTTHWYQLRCVLAKPVSVVVGQTVTGSVRLVAHRRQSYDVHVSLVGADGVESSGVFDLKEPYYRQMTPQGWSAQGLGPIIQASAAGVDAAPAAGAGTASP